MGPVFFIAVQEPVVYYPDVKGTWINNQYTTISINCDIGDYFIKHSSTIDTNMISKTNIQYIAEYWKSMFVF
jgi:hypothetical protein